MSHLVRDYLDELQASFGGAAAPIDSRVLKTLYDRKEYASMLGWIKNSMRLDLRVGLRIVDGAEPSPPMWIEMPQPMPTYGSDEFRRARVIVNARRDVLEGRSFACVVAGFSHELSHVVLSATGHRLRRDEKAVDLTAMLLGYQSFIADAEVTKSQFALWPVLLTALLLPFGVLFWRGPTKRTWRLGYLTRAEAAAARQYLAQGQGAFPR